ncbi:glycosyltransferase [bacterium]|jgi:glycosyltransferase involved in cell wall biosynthesis|nr:glycosyltransferase [bacterium]
MPIGCLYISYDGILEPLGQSQVLSYLEGLANERTIHLISFEKPSDKKNQYLYNQVDSRIKKSNIQWHPLIYHKKPTAIATLWDIFCATALGFWLILRYNLKIVHARSYVASLSALIFKKIFGTYYIFDMRGFWADERVDGEIWTKSGYLYYITKQLEKSFLLNADVVVSLTHKAVLEMKKFPYLDKRGVRFEVITTCADLKLFKPKSNFKKQNKPLTIGYVGSVGVWYLFEEAMDYFKLIKKIVPDVRLHIINKGGHKYIYKCLEELGIDQKSVFVETIDHSDVPRAMQSMDAGLFIIKPAYSKISSTPTKLGEFLGCGVPCICNSKVGDMSEIVNNNKVGVVLDSFDKSTKNKSILQLLKLILDPDIQHRCRATALKHFSLADGIDSYKRIYRSLDGQSHNG